MFPSRVIRVQAENSPDNIPGAKIASEGVAGQIDAIASVLENSHELLNKYGSRPYWQKKPYGKGETVPAIDASDIVSHLIPCESQDISVKHMDSNDRYSYGVLQIQSSTWALWSRASGIKGNPMNSVDAVSMGLWAVEHGLLQNWTCAKILKIIK